MISFCDDFGKTPCCLESRKVFEDNKAFLTLKDPKVS
jgi:hypothetical protein